ncbi:MAG: efflux RND transporter periplasmic adaptor subunit [Pseudomonadota bacterium]
MRRPLVWVVLVVVAAVAGWLIFGRHTTARVNYETATVDKGTVERTVSSSGSVAALVTVDVGSQISGQIAVLNADFNSEVKKGDLLAVLDPQTYKSRVASAEADLAVARANVGSQQANLKKAQTSLEQADRDLKRSQQLADQKLISVSDVEATRKAHELAQSDLEIAQAQVRNAQAAVQTRQAALDQSRIDLSRTEIRSPIDGVVIQRNISRGQTVAASLQAPVLFQIAQDLQRIQIEAKVDEADIGAIKAEDLATFSVDAFPEQQFRGRVAQVRLASTTVQNVVTYSVMVQAENPRQILLPGMTANVRIVTDRRENVLRVPNDAARFQPAGATRATQGGAPGGGGPGGGQGGQGGGFAAQNAEMAKELGLSKEQEAQLDKGRRELFEQVRAAAPQGGGLAAGGLPGGPGGPFGGDQQQQAMRARQENLMRSVLTPEQLQKWQSLRSARGAGARARSGTLWTLENATPKSNTVRLGLADDRFTEIVEGDLKEGDKVIVRARTELKK